VGSGKERRTGRALGERGGEEGAIVSCLVPKKKRKKKIGRIEKQCAARGAHSVGE